MTVPFRRAALIGAAIALGAGSAAAQTRVTNQGITDSEIVLGTHQDLSNPIKGWGVAVANGMKMAAEELNAAGSVQGRQTKLLIEHSANDPKRDGLATHKLTEKEQVVSMGGPMGSSTELAAPA